MFRQIITSKNTIFTGIKCLEIQGSVITLVYNCLKVEVTVHGKQNKRSKQMCETTILSSNSAQIWRSLQT